MLMAIMFDRFGKAASRETVTLPVDSQKFYLLPQTWDIYPTARYIEKPLQYIHLAVAFIFSSIIRILSFVINLVAVTVPKFVPVILVAFNVVTVATPALPK